MENTLFTFLELLYKVIKLVVLLWEVLKHANQAKDEITQIGSMNLFCAIYNLQFKMSLYLLFIRTFVHAFSARIATGEQRIDWIS